MFKKEAVLFTIAIFGIPALLFLGFDQNKKFTGQYGSIWNDSSSSQMSSKDAGPYPTLQKCETELKTARKNNAHIYRECVKY